MPRQHTLSAFFPSGGKGKGSTDEFQRGMKRPRFAKDTSRFGTCPLCGTCLPMHVLVHHAETCNGIAETENKSVSQAKTCKEEEVVADQEQEKNKSTADVAAANLTPDSASKDSKDDTMIPWWKVSSKKHSIENPIVHSSEPIPGLYLFEEFITEQEEAQILAQLDGKDQQHDISSEFLPWKPANFNGPHWVKRWGVHCNLRDRRVSEPENPMPHFFHALVLPRLKRLSCMLGCIPNEANAIDYYKRKGHYLASHVDDRQLSKEPIANLSLAGDCYMVFQNQKKGRGEPQRVLLKRRTLQVLTGKARYDYSHGIQNQDLLSDRRVSVTMRESPLTKKV